mmetsp:Transcript_8685/g.15767  ORF Transcript_8685/g.15767 Transcript_8685/m.15767 type:complete len:226 (-) Transcript_8685:802-1479(-)
MARLWMAKHAWAETRGDSLMRTLFNPVTKSLKRLGGTQLAWSSQMRPRVQAVVSLTMLWGSLRAWIKTGIDWLTKFPILPVPGPSSMQQKAMVLASLNLQFSPLIFCSTKGMTASTTPSPTVLATSVKHVEEAMAAFQILSSKSASSSCLVSASSRSGLSCARAAVTYPLQARLGCSPASRHSSISSKISISSSQRVDQNSMAWVATCSSSVLMLLNVSCASTCM